MQREQINAFRYAQHSLLKPLPLSQLEGAAAATLQNSIPGTVALSLAVRVKGFTLEALDVAIFKKKSLVEITGIRGASFVVPSSDFSVFTSAAFPTKEKDLERLMGSHWKDLKKAKISAQDAVKQITAVTLQILDRKALSQDEIHAEWRKRLPKPLLYWCRGCKTNHVPYSIVMAVGIQGTFCFGPVKSQSGQSDPSGMTAYVRADQWLPKQDIDNDLERTREKLVKRFLQFYGPSNSSRFSVWAGVSAAEAKEFWALIEDQVVEVDRDQTSKSGAPVWILKKDAGALRSPATPQGVMLLPPKDAYLAAPDREITTLDKKHIPKIWKILGNPGVIVLDGEIVGTWRGSKKGAIWGVQFEPFGKIPARAKKEAEARMELLAPFRACTTVQFKWK